jgi:hypothetical protein
VRNTGHLIKALQSAAMADYAALPDDMADWARLAFE